MVERTLSIIKPDCVKKGDTGKIIGMIEANGFSIISIKKIKLTEKQAKAFYYIHRDKPFYDSLCAFMSSGFSIVMVLEKDNCIADYRNLMGATDPKKSQRNTIRNLYGTNIEQNAVHGSDSLESAKFEIGFFSAC